MNLGVIVLLGGQDFLAALYTCVEIFMNIKRCSMAEQLRDTWKLIFTITVILMAVVIVNLFFTKSDASKGLLIGLITGIVVHWMLYAKASIQVDSMLVPYAKNWITAHGYVFSKEGSEFVPNVHWLLRFKSQNIRFIRIDDAKVKIICPYSILKNLEKNLPELP